MADSALDLTLPTGWIRHENQEIGAFYYFNTLTGASQWEHPSKVSASLSGSPPELLLAAPSGFRAPLSSSADNPFIDNSFSEPAGTVDIPVGGKHQDYIGLAKLYKIQQPYRSTTLAPICVLCHKQSCQDVFFPCEHRCVCINCIKKESICSMVEAKPDQNCHTTCPLCASAIKIILPFANGQEKEEYWKWVEEVKPELPVSFMRNWRHSAAIIQKVYIDEKFAVVKSPGCFSCTIS